MNKIFPILAILMIVAVSGCIGGGTGGTTTGGTGSGLEITDFSSDLTDVYSTKTTRVMMNVENQGDREVDKDKGLALLIGGYDWEDGTLLRAQELKKNLMAADPTREIPAGISLFQWTLKAPVYPRGQQKTDQLIGRVYYDYETKAIGSVWLYPASEATAARDAKEPLQKSSFSSTTGPVSLEVTVSPDPVEVEQAGDYFTLYIKVTNTGDGKIYRPNIVTSACSKFKTSRPTVGTVLGEGCAYQGCTWVGTSETVGVCSDPTPAVTAYDLSEVDLNKPTIGISYDNTQLLIEDPSCYNDVEVIGGATTVICDIKLLKMPITKRSYPITVTADYGYYKDSELSLTVIGK